MHKFATTVKQISYNEYLNAFKKTNGINRWILSLSINQKPNISQLDFFIFYYLEERAKKIVRWKIQQYIILTKELPMQRQIDNISQCHVFDKDKDYRKVNYTNRNAVIDPVSLTILFISILINLIIRSFPCEFVASQQNIPLD
jgi:hypothetical protein